MKKFAAIMVVIMACVFAFGTAFANPEKIEMKNKKGTIQFDHKGHQAKVKACKDCHHKSEAGKEEKCTKCHTDKADGKKLEAKEAFHKQCKGCHQKQKGPTKCDECHKK